MSYHIDMSGKRILIDKSECRHLADEYICMCEASSYYMDIPPDGNCYKESGCANFGDETISDGFCKNQGKDMGG